MKQNSGFKPMVENSLNLTNYSLLETGYEHFQYDSIKNGSIYHLDETDISILNTMNSNNSNTQRSYPTSVKKNEISSTLKEIDDLLTRLKPIKEPIQAQYPLPSVKGMGYPNYSMNTTVPINYNKSPIKSTIIKKTINSWDIPFVGNDSFIEKKKSEIWVPKEKDFEVFLMDRNFKLKQITKNFYGYLNSINPKYKNSKQMNIFNSIYKYYLSIISNDGNSIGLYCDIKQIEKYLGEFLNSLSFDYVDCTTIKIWLLSLRGRLIAKEKHNKIKSILKLGGGSENNLSINSNSITYANEMESIENIESDEDFTNDE